MIGLGNNKYQPETHETRCGEMQEWWTKTLFQNQHQPIEN